MRSLGKEMGKSCGGTSMKETRKECWLKGYLNEKAYARMSSVQTEDSRLLLL